MAAAEGRHITQAPLTVVDLAERFESESQRLLSESATLIASSYVTWLVSKVKPAFGNRLLIVAETIRGQSAEEARATLKDLHSSWSNEEAWFDDLRAEVDRRGLI